MWLDTYRLSLPCMNDLLGPVYTISSKDTNISSGRTPSIATSASTPKPTNEYDCLTGGIMLELCPECGEKYCKANSNPNDTRSYAECADYEIKTCDICEKKKCRACMDIFNCNCCGRNICDGGCGDSLWCCAGDCYADYDRMNCMDCAANDPNACTKQCGQCRQAFCYECDPEMEHLGNVACEDCRNRN